MAGTISSKSPDTQSIVMEMAQATAPIALKYGHMNVANVNGFMF